jgi:hypothetical protein
MPKGPQGQKRKANLIGDIVKLIEEWEAQA